MRDLISNQCDTRVSEGYQRRKESLHWNGIRALESIFRLEAVGLDATDIYFSIICFGKYRFELDCSLIQL